jgi:hypothetical protein
MPEQLAHVRPTCSYCCKPFTEQDPGRLVQSHTYIGGLSAPVSDPSKPDCAAVKLANDVVLCRACCEQFGYPSGEGVGTSKPSKRRGRKSNSDPKADKRIWDAWKTRAHKTHEQLAVTLGISTPDAKHALDRHRKRTSNAGSTRAGKPCQDP